jgi:hypothetical protein
MRDICAIWRSFNSRDEWSKERKIALVGITQQLGERQPCPLPGTIDGWRLSRENAGNASISCRPYSFLTIS